VSILFTQFHVMLITQGEIPIPLEIGHVISFLPIIGGQFGAFDLVETLERAVFGNLIHPLAANAEIAVWFSYRWMGGGGFHLSGRDRAQSSGFSA